MDFVRLKGVVDMDNSFSMGSGILRDVNFSEEIRAPAKERTGPRHVKGGRRKKRKRGLSDLETSLKEEVMFSSVDDDAGSPRSPPLAVNPCCL
ncbi:hypothetical protein CDAR_96201 [Caerostris darwini]|uniref:Uncharacterized protein n=1 Tax=Caerostris darwini TaxID=1538125 RepID=A0AAV4TQ70_9ARAC|nr:hypothetical protein CDAR_96201 [Caerostris darwini]